MAAATGRPMKNAWRALPAAGTLDLGPWTLDFGLFETEFMLRKSLYFTGPCRLELREEPLDAPGPGQVLVRTLMSAISPGTEMLIYRGGSPGNGRGRRP
jgi:hypothetical protein